MGSTREQIEAVAPLCEQYPDAWNKCQPEQFEREYPAHTVTLGGFWIDRHEVTNAQYSLCVQAGACRPSRLTNDEKYNGGDFPAAGIPWRDAVDYCSWAGARLPTEAEWEFAARSPESLIYPWGQAFVCEGGNFLDESTDCEDGYSGSSPVGSFRQGDSWVGAWDMAGNVWEWVADEFSTYSGASETEANTVTSSDTHILRGGSWGYTPAFVRAAYRYPVPPEADYLAVGFRCAVSGEERLVGDIGFAMGRIANRTYGEQVANPAYGGVRKPIRPTGERVTNPAYGGRITNPTSGRAGYQSSLWRSDNQSDLRASGLPI